MKRALPWLALVALLAGGLALVGGSVSAQTGISATITCSQYLRMEPSEDSQRIGLMNAGETNPALGRYGDWLLLQVGSELQGWAYYGNCMTVNGAFTALPVVDPAQIAFSVLTAPPTASVVCSQYLRRAPANGAEVLQVLSEADNPLSISQRTADNSWLQVTTASGLVGWAAYTECLRVQGNFYAVPSMTEAAAAYSGPPIGTLACTQNLRAYPGNDGRRLAVLAPSVGVLDVVGRTADQGWAYISSVEGWQGWMATGSCLRIQGKFADAPVMELEGYSGAPIAQIGCEQYLRAAPRADAAVVRVLGPADGPVAVAGRTENGGWVYLVLADGTAGWTGNGSCVSVLGNVLSAPDVVSGVTNVTVNIAPTARIACSQYLRATPNAEGARLAIMQPSDGIYNVEGRNADGTWLYLSLPGSFQGWAAWGSCLDVQGNVYSLPELDQVSAAGEPVATVVCTQYLRTAPDMNARTLDPMPAGTALSIEGRSSDGGWVFVTKPDGSQGWTALGSCLNVVGNVYSRPVIAPDQYTGPAVATVSCSQYLRRLPEDNAPTLVTLNGIEGELHITGRSANSSWMQIALQDGTVGWAATGVCLGVRGDFYSVPVIDTTAAPYAGPPMAAVNCSQYLRVLPDRQAETLFIVNGVEGDLAITGRTSDNAWMQITLENGTVGWAATNACLSVVGRLTDAPAIDVSSPEYTGPAVATIVCDQNLRATPSGEGERIDVVRIGDGLLNLVGRNDDASWLYVQVAADGREGWTANGSCLAIQGNVMGLPLREVSSYDGPPVADVVCDTNLRRTPQASGDVLAVVGADSGLFSIVARDAEARWLLIESGSGLTGWVSQGDCLETQGNVGVAPIPFANANMSLWTVLRAEGGCSGSDSASQVIAAYNRTAPIGPVSRQCTSNSAGLLALAQMRTELAIVSGSCPGFQSVALSGGQSICFRNVHTTQVDDFINYARGR